MQRFFDVVQDRNGTCIPNALVYVYVGSTSTLATLYSDNGVTPTVNPVTTNSDGEYAFYAANGTYTLSIQATGFDSQSRPGTIIFDPADGGQFVASNVSFTQVGTGAVIRTVQAKLEESISVKDFGATGDGVTNDYTAVLNALTAGKGKAVYFPAGTYLLNSSITMDSTFSNTDIYGDGPGSVIKTGDAATQATFYIRQVSNLSIRSLKFDGNSAAQSSVNARLVLVDRASTNLSFYDVWFFNSYSDNVWLNWTSGFGAVNTVNFTDCRFENVVRSVAANILLWNTENITFQGCYFTGYNYDAIACNFFAPTVTGGLVVDSCYFQNINSTLFAIEFVAGDNSPGDRFYRIKNVNITNNVFDANSTPIGGSGISGWADYVSIVGNTWRRSNGGSWREGIEAVGNYWTISSNVFDDSRIVLSTISTASSGTNYIVTNNSIRVSDGDQRWGIQIGYNGTFDGVIVANNVIELINVTTPNTGAINVGTYDLSAVLTNVLVTNNIMSHNNLVAGVNGVRLRCVTGSNNIVINQNTMINFDIAVRADSPAVATDVTISDNIVRNCNTSILLDPAVTARVFGNNYSASYALVSADRGDANVTIVPGVDAPTQQFATPLTTNRTVTLSSTNAFTGASFKVVRTAASTGASTLSVGGLKTLASGEWATVEYTGSAWLLTGFGAL